MIEYGLRYGSRLTRAEPIPLLIISQVQRNSFQWFHEEDLPLEAITVVPPVRLQFLADLKARV